MSVAALARDERLELAELVETLTPQQWDAPSLCARWRVRDVVAHVVSYDGLGPAGLAGRFVRGRFLLDRIDALGVHEHRERGQHELAAALRAHAVPSGLPAALGGRVALVDTLVHALDVRRPLGLPRAVPLERLRAALPFALVAPPIAALWHVRGVRVVATDVDWSAGRGPEARGPAEGVLVAMAGRRGVAHELSGLGADRLVRRLG